MIMIVYYHDHSATTIFDLNSDGAMNIHGLIKHYDR